ncbi:MAG: SDR family oxidoreductase [Desulfovibrio sp.]|jgi:3-oxoacyl-[acyl-carrier protein] reductase|nr:SDR family oxidoreductase [Desulfovibrio sp.]
MKLIAVTGAGAGLGRHIAQRALEQGYEVAGFSRSKPGKDPGFPLTVGDVTDHAAVAAFFASLRKKGASCQKESGKEGLWGIVNAAGIASMNLLPATPPATMADVLKVNLLGVMHCCAEGAKLLLRDSGRKGGRVVNFSSIAAPLALAGESVYAASKAGVETFTRCLARELAPFNITANVVAPGPIATGILRGLSQEQIDAVVQRQVVRRMAEPEDVWNLVRFLLDERSSMISGEIIHLGGV